MKTTFPGVGKKVNTSDRGLLGFMSQNPSETPVCLDHEPETSLKNHSLCHEHSPPTFLFV